MYDQYDIFRPYNPLPLMIQDSTWQCAFDNNAIVFIPPSFGNTYSFFSNYRCVLLSPWHVILRYPPMARFLCQ